MNQTSQKEVQSIKVAVICPWFYEGDAVGESARNQYRAFASMENVQVKAVGTLCDFSDLDFITCESLDALQECEWLNSADLLVFHYAIYHEFFEVFRDAQVAAKSVTQFHNVTPKRWMPAQHVEIVEKSVAQLPLLGECKAIWVDSRENALELIRHGVVGRDVKEVPLSVERPPLRPIVVSTPQLANLLYVGRIASSKGVLELVEMAAVLRQKDPGLAFSLRLVGNLRFSDPEYVEAVRSRIAERGLASHVHLVGTVDERTLEFLYQETQVFVSASRHEGFCVPVIEAMRAGAIPVTYNAANLRWIAGGLGKTVNTGDVMSLATEVGSMLRTLADGHNQKGQVTIEVDSGAYDLFEYQIRVSEYLHRFDFSALRDNLMSELERLLPAHKVRSKSKFRHGTDHISRLPEAKTSV